MKQNLVNHINARFPDITKKAAGELVDEVFAKIRSDLKKNGRFSMIGFGSLVVRKTKARKGTNPNDQTPIKIKAGKTVRFRASDDLRKTVASAPTPGKATPRALAA